MGAIKTLVLMQLKEKLNLKGRNLKTKYTFFNIVFSIIKFALIIALCFGLLFVCKYLQLFSLLGYFPTSPIVVVFTVMMIISIISCTVSLDKALYFSNDNPLLLTLPCKPTQVFLSKLIVFFINELIKNLSFMVPLFLAFGIINGYPIYYYLWVFVAFIFISLIPVLLGSILSIPTMFIYNYYRQYKWLQIVTLLIIIGGISIGVIKGISLIPSDINLIKTWGTTFWQIQDFLELFIAKFAIFNDIVEMIVGSRVNFVIKMFRLNNLLTFGLIILSIIALLFISLFITKPLFYKMASKPFEYKKMNKKIKQNHKVTKGLSILKTELLLSLRDSDRLFSTIVQALLMPILLFLLNKIYAAMGTAALGNNMEISFNILIMLLISLSSNSFAASIYSKDGRSSYLIKVQPSKYQPLLFAKLLFNFIFMSMSYVATFIVINNFTGLSVLQSFLITCGCYFLTIAHMLFSALQDIMNPQIELYATIGSSENNPNETKSIVVAFILSFVVFGGMLLLLIENNKIITYYKLFFFGLVLLLYEIYDLTDKVKLYYKEK